LLPELSLELTLSGLFTLPASALLVLWATSRGDDAEPIKVKAIPPTFGDVRDPCLPRPRTPL